MGYSNKQLPSCSVLQCVAVSGRVWQGVAGCCSVWQGVAVCGRVLQCVAVWGSVWQCVAECCSVLQCVAVGIVGLVQILPPALLSRWGSVVGETHVCGGVGSIWLRCMYVEVVGSIWLRYMYVEVVGSIWLRYMYVEVRGTCRMRLRLRTVFNAACCSVL